MCSKKGKKVNSMCHGLQRPLKMKNCVTVAVPLIVSGLGRFLSRGLDLFAREGPEVEGGCSIQKREVPSFESSSV